MSITVTSAFLCAYIYYPTNNYGKIENKDELCVQHLHCSTVFLHLAEDK